MTLEDNDACDLEWDVDRGGHAIERAVERMDRTRMERDADTLAAALMRDLISAEDFASRSA